MLEAPLIVLEAVPVGSVPLALWTGDGVDVRPVVSATADCIVCDIVGVDIEIDEVRVAAFASESALDWAEPTAARDPAKTRSLSSRGSQRMVVRIRRYLL